MLTSVLLATVFGHVLGRIVLLDDTFLHQSHKIGLERRSFVVNPENKAEFWEQKARNVLEEKLSRTMNKNMAKNVVFFLGDGMSIPTLSAARAYLGGEAAQLSFDKFPYTGLVKTYCVDHQVADSACSVTAYLGGVKANLGTIGVTGDVKKGDCEAMLDPQNHVDSIIRQFQLKGRKTGLVTTTRVTHASPAGVYAHTAHRDWEWDAKVLQDNQDPNKCPDIAHQMVFGQTGRSLNVVLGGGLAGFQSNKIPNGAREDDLNLVEEWLSQRQWAKSDFVSTRTDLQSLDGSVENLLGLFNLTHMNYNLESDRSLEPTLSEMTKTAIEILQKSDEGFFLFVEGGLIDVGHHMTQAHKALDETVELSKAVQTALDLVDLQNTLVLVTSDHAHTMSYSGYGKRGDNILGIGGEAADQLPYTTLNYANGPGYKNSSNSYRYDVSNDDINSVNYQYPSLSPMQSETHGGDDVAVFATGPWAHLFTGVMEQNVIPHLIGYAACVSDYKNVCSDSK